MLRQKKQHNIVKRTTGQLNYISLNPHILATNNFQNPTTEINLPCHLLSHTCRPLLYVRKPQGSSSGCLVELQDPGLGKWLARYRDQTNVSISIVRNTAKYLTSRSNVQPTYTKLQQQQN